METEGRGRGAGLHSKSSGKRKNPNNGVPTAKGRDEGCGSLSLTAYEEEKKEVRAALEKKRTKASGARPKRGEALKGGEGEEPREWGPLRGLGVGAGKRLRAGPAGDPDPAAAEKRQKPKRLELAELP